MSFPSLKRDFDVSPSVSNKCEFDLAGVVLKMARLIKDGTVKGGKSEAVKDALRKPPLKSYIILGKDFVQIVAKVSSGLMASGIQVFFTSEAAIFYQKFLNLKLICVLLLGVCHRMYC
jgi:hypothetical protein